MVTIRTRRIAANIVTLDCKVTGNATRSPNWRSSQCDPRLGLPQEGHKAVHVGHHAVQLMPGANNLSHIGLCCGMVHPDHAVTTFEGRWDYGISRKFHHAIASVP